ncbi:MAG: hypothetical protein ACOCZ7_00320 [Armatimonadota bacterium]
MAEREARSGLSKGLFYFVLVTLIGSCIYAIHGILVAPSQPAEGVAYGKVTSDYSLMLVQCLLGIAALLLPSMLERRLHITIPNFMYILFIIFLYAAIYLGEVRSFYYRVPHWDLILHGFSGLMLGALSFSVISLLNHTERIRTAMSPGFVAVFAFCFAVSMGVMWEIWEFAADGILGLNMQKFENANGIPYIGRDALMDTMSDLIVDAIGALIMSVVGYVSVKCRNDWMDAMIAKRDDDVKDDAKAARESAEMC